MIQHIARKLDSKNIKRLVQIKYIYKTAKKTKKTKKKKCISISVFGYGNKEKSTFQKVLLRDMHLTVSL